MCAEFIHVGGNVCNIFSCCSVDDVFAFSSTVLVVLLCLTLLVPIKCISL